MVQGDDLALAEQQLNYAIQLEPENGSNLFTLAQVEVRNHDFDDARRTIQPLLLPNADARLRTAALDLMQKIAASEAQ